jgi:hypothetical protein
MQFKLWKHKMHLIRTGPSLEDQQAAAEVICDAVLQKIAVLFAQSVSADDLLWQTRRS